MIKLSLDQNTYYLRYIKTGNLCVEPLLTNSDTCTLSHLDLTCLSQSRLFFNIQLLSTMIDTFYLHFKSALFGNISIKIPVRSSSLFKLAYYYCWLLYFVWTSYIVLYEIYNFSLYYIQLNSPRAFQSASVVKFRSKFVTPSVSFFHQANLVKKFTNLCSVSNPVNVYARIKYRCVFYFYQTPPMSCNC